MNKCGWALGLAAIAALAGCRDPNYGNKNPGASQNEPTPVVLEPKSSRAEAKAGPARGPLGGPIIVETVEGPKCTCAPGTKHPGPCACGAPDCRCQVAVPPGKGRGQPGQPIAGRPGAAGRPGVAGRPGAAGQSSAVAQPIAAGVQPGETAGAGTTFYIVQRGDYLSKISKKFNIRIDAIRKLNPQIKKDIVRIGQKIKLPGKVNVGEQTVPKGSFAHEGVLKRHSAPKAAAGVPVLEAPKAAAKGSPAAKPAGKAKKEYKPYTGATKEYVVKAGDIVGGIAYRNGLTIRQFKELNGLTSDNLKIGQKLKVPAEKPSVDAAAKPAGKVASSAEKPVEKPVEKAEAEKASDAEKPQPVAGPEKAPEVKPEAAPDEAAPAPAEAAAAPAKAPRIYIVKENEDLTHIAISHGCTATVLRELNNLTDGDQLVVGQKIKLPPDPEP